MTSDAQILAPPASAGEGADPRRRREAQAGAADPELGPAAAVATTVKGD